VTQHWLKPIRAGDVGSRAAAVDTSVAHIARVYDYWLGGKDNFAADDPYGIVATLVEAMPAGSHLVVSHPASDIEAEAMVEIAESMNELVAEKVTFRSQAEVSRFFDGLELVDPGLVPVPRWRPASLAEEASPTVLWGGVGRKG
jgi:hypothetical protein